MTNDKDAPSIRRRDPGRDRWQAGATPSLSLKAQPNAIGGSKDATKGQVAFRFDI
jgi:hypothetical protein